MMVMMMMIMQRMNMTKQTTNKIKTDAAKILMDNHIGATDQKVGKERKI